MRNYVIPRYIFFTASNYNHKICRNNVFKDGKVLRYNNDVICEVRGIFCQKIEDYEKEKTELLLRLVRKVIKQ